MIETDDQTVEQMRVLAKTQKLLADQGVTFDNSFVSLSLCCPSRATFLTGQYAHNHHVVSNVAPDGGYRKLTNSRTLPVWLKRSGYTTSFVGKYLNGYGIGHPHRVPQGWMNFHGLLDFSYFNYKMNDNGVLHGYGHKAREYQTDVLTRKAVRVIHEDQQARRPWFLWLTYFAPHAGGPSQVDGPIGMGVPHPAPKYKYAFDGASLPRNPAFNEADVSDKPLAVQHRRLLTPQEILDITIAYRKQLETLLSVDDGVARVIKTLQRTHQLGNTYIFFTCDNGIFHGEHRIPSGKVLLYEPSIRVPLIVRGPGIPRGAHAKELASNIDLAPTILALARTKPPHVTLDGRSLIPLLHHPTKAWGRDLLIERLKETGEGAPGTHQHVWTGGETGNGDSGNQGKPGTPFDRAYDAIRTPRFIYAEYANGAREMYDLWHDPYELQNIASRGKSVYSPVEQDLSRRLANLRDCAGADCRVGPRVKLSLVSVGRQTSSTRCAVSRVRASVSGPDSRWVKSVRFFTGRRLRSLTRVAPFSTSLKLKPLQVSAKGDTTARVRARVLLVDGRRVDRTRPVPLVCR